MTFRCGGRAIAPVALVVLLAGCTTQMSPVPEESQAEDGPSAPSQPTPPGDSGGEDGDVAEGDAEGDVDEGPVLTECDAGERGGMEGTIVAQTSAFADGDFERAYSYASPSFQSAVTLDAFTQLIASSYGPLIDQAELRFGDCLSDSNRGLGTMDARFDQDGIDVFAIRYVLQETDEGWRVDGASNLELIGQGT
jgi:hypothetical protein